MDFKDQIKILGERVLKLKDQIATEEATKNAFIMPFIQSLGYDIFNPTEVVPEFISDIGTKKGEKIDYAILQNNVPIILFECKHWSINLDIYDGQLLRYFHVSKARFAILTNGIIYRFYSDLEEANKMDEKPFLELNITELKDYQIEELKKFHKSYFDPESILNTASDLKYSNELRQLLSQELSNPSPEFVKIFAKRVYPSSVTAKVLEQFTNLTKKAAQALVSEIITERLNIALHKEKEASAANEAPIVDESESKIDTTEEELECFMIVKSILRQKIDIKRIVYRDAQSYFAILLDNNNRKPICRLYLNSNKKYIAILDENKKEIKTVIESLDDIYNFSEQLLEIIDRY